MKKLFLIMSVVFTFCCSADEQYLEIGPCQIDVSEYTKGNRKDYKQFDKYDGFLKKNILLRTDDVGMFEDEYLEINYSILGDVSEKSANITFLAHEDMRYDFQYSATIINTGDAELVLEGFSESETRETLSSCFSVSTLERLFGEEKQRER